MKNFKFLLLQEARGQLKTFSFLVMILTALAVGLLVTRVQVTSFKDRWAVYREQQQQSQDRLADACYYSQIKVDVYMPPTVLSVFAKGLDETVGNKITVSALDLPEPVFTSQRGDAFLKIFNNMDIAGVMKILSIFIILMATCPIALDREQQIGKLIFSGPVGRLEYYLSKYVSLLVVACIGALVAFFIPLVWIWFDPQVSLSLPEAGSILYMLFLSVLYFSVFIFIGLAVSAMSAKISTATLSGLMVWVMLAYVYPFAVNSVIDRTVKVTSDSVINDRIEKLENKIRIETLQFIKDNNLSGGGTACNYSTDGRGIIEELSIASKALFIQGLKSNEFSLPKWFNHINTVTEMKENQKKQLLRKKTLYDRFAFFLPDRIYQNLCEAATGTDYHFREERFIEAAKNYRTILMEYTQSKNGFGYAYFTQLPKAEMRDDYSDYSPDMIDKYCEEENLSKIASGIPQFNHPHRPPGFMAWLGLLLTNIILGGISLWIYNKHLSFK
jgi:ABC-type transport system involved in multi-copper enzyme maturation permease subunit